MQGSKLTSSEAEIVSIGKSFVVFVVVFSLAKTEVVSASFAQAEAVRFR